MLPSPDPDSRPFWDGCRDGVLRLQQCKRCHRFRFPPRRLCPVCHSSRLRWATASGFGRIYVSLTVHHSLHPSMVETVPFNLSIIELDEGVRLWSNVVDSDPEAVQIGDRVRVICQDVGGGMTLPRFAKTDTVRLEEPSR